MKSLHLNTSYKHHTTIGIIQGLWLAAFLVIIAPFDASDLSFAIRLRILPFYGIIAILSYLLLLPLQNFIFKALGRWNIALEIAYIFAFTTLVLVGSYTYYKTDIINGDASFFGFTFHIYYPIVAFSLTILIFLRWFLNKSTSKPVSKNFILKGENKLDVLQVERSNLICIASADNYVEVSHLVNGVLKKKLLRTTLKKVQAAHTSLLKVHRSYLINPIHFIDWKDSTTINVTGMQVPISKTYKKELLSLQHSPQKTPSSSQSQ